MHLQIKSNQKHVLDLYKRRRRRRRKNSAIGDEASGISSVPHTHTHTHTHTISLCLSLSLLKVEKARSGMPIYKVPSSNQSGAPDLDSTVCTHSTLFVPNRVLSTSYSNWYCCECNNNSSCREREMERWRERDGEIEREMQRERVCVCCYYN
jgi:hypothetical protein